MPKSKFTHMLKIMTLAANCVFLPWTVQAKDLVDVLGREVTVPDHVERVVLGEGRLSYAMALVDKKTPFDRIVGWQNDLRRLDPHTFKTLEEAFPHVADIPVIGQASEASVNVETILKLKPDLVIFSVAGEGPKAHSPIADTLVEAGIAVIYVDFRVNAIENTPRSVELIGQALGHEDEAKAFADFFKTHLDRITKRVAEIDKKERPSVFAELLGGVWPTPGHTTGNGGIGQMVALAGGENIAAGIVPGAIGDVAVEYALTADPDVYFVTGNRAPGLLLGPGVDEKTARESLDGVLERPEFSALSAIKKARAHGLWHDFYASPYNIVAVEVMAKWFHPEKFADVDPQATMQEIRETFLGFDNSGTYWVDPSK